MNETQAILIIGVITTALLQVINAAGHWWGTRPAIKRVDRKLDDAGIHLVNADRKMDRAEDKLKHIEYLTNSSMDALKEKLKIALERIDRLEVQLLRALDKNKETMTRELEERLDSEKSA